MTADEKDLILGGEFQRATDKGLPQPSWGEIEARAGVSSRGRLRSHRKVVLALTAALTVIVVPALAFAAHAVFFDSSPAPFESAIYAFSTVGGAPGRPADEQSVVVEPRRVMTLTLSNDQTAALWAAPTIDGNYCFANQAVTGDPDSPGQGIDWGHGFDGDLGCGKRDNAFDVGYSASVSSDSSPSILVFGGSGLRDADSVEVAYEDGSTSEESAVYVSSPLDTVLFMFQIPDDHIASGSRPVELILRAADSSVLARDKALFSGLWQQYDEAVARQGESGGVTPGEETPGCEFDPSVPGAIPGPECGPIGSGYEIASMPNSPGYQYRNVANPGNAHP